MAVKRRRRGGRKQGNQEAFWGNDVQWNPIDFVPGWVPIEDLPAPGGASNALPLPSTAGFLPLYLNNDELAEGPKIYTLILGQGSPIGFSKEIYVLNEALDTNPGAPLEDSETYNLSLTILINQNNQPKATPQIVAGSAIKMALLVIEDAEGPSPVVLNGDNNSFSGSAGIDLIYAGGGQDTVNGNAGNDLLRGGKGDDNLKGNEGRDNLLGEAGNDRLSGGDQDDALYGGTGNDQLSGNDGNDILDGMEGDDVLNGGPGYDILLGSYGNDILRAGNGGSEDPSIRLENNLFGDDGNDILIGGDISDLLDGGAGVDRMEGGLGNDTYVVDNLGDVIVEALDAGIDTVESFIDWTLAAGLENLFLSDTAVNGTGNAQDNTISGNELNNTLMGGAGNDDISGQSGNDRLKGGAGNDELTGSEGNDILKGGAGSDRLNGWGFFGTSDSQNDNLQGGVGNDTFVLGSSFSGVFYNQSSDDYALIQDWEAAIDRIEVTGNADQYTLQFVSVNGVGTTAQDTEIYFNGDRIAIIQDNTDVSSVRDFQFI